VPTNPSSFKTREAKQKHPTEDSIYYHSHSYSYI
jgi:hypothetical protein